MAGIQGVNEVGWKCCALLVGSHGQGIIVRGECHRLQQRLDYAYADSLLAIAEDKKKQATNLAKFDSRIRENLREGLNMLTGGLAFKEKGSFGNIYGNDKAQKEKFEKQK